MMNRLFIFAVAVGALVGCSRETEVDPSTENELLGGASAAGVPAVDSTAMGDTLNSVKTDLQAGRYEEVAIKMGTLNQLPKTPEQERAFKEAYYEVQEVLSLQAQRDAKAAAAYQRFGQMMMGR